MQCFDTKAAKMCVERSSSLGIVVDFSILTITQYI